MLQERVSRFHHADGKRQPLGKPVFTSSKAETRTRHFKTHHLLNQGLTILNFSHDGEKINYTTFSHGSLTDYEITGSSEQLKPIVNLAIEHKTRIRKLSV